MNFVLQMMDLIQDYSIQPESMIVAMYVHAVVEAVCLLCIHMPAIDRSRSNDDCRYGDTEEASSDDNSEEETSQPDDQPAPAVTAAYFHQMARFFAVFYQKQVNFG